jgi:signal transduction histidine kinase
MTGQESRLSLLSVRRQAQVRQRIAGELHDVVTHSVSVMVVQAAAARRLVPTDPARAREAMEAIERTGREALNEMRRLLGVLRRGDEDIALTPQPTLKRLDLIAQYTGMHVDLTVEGEPPAIPPGLDVAAYRVVQEALTNAGKHAPGGPVTVTLDLREGELAVSVVNRRATRPPTALPSGGLGLIGLRERVRTVGGTLRAEPRLDGGFGVEAVLPA